MITDEDKERVRQATDILQVVGETVELRQRGNDFWGCCPFHHEKSPSFHVNPATGLWKCFGCGEGGDLFAYIMKRESLDFPDSIRYLADRAGIELSEETNSARRGPKRNRLIECLTEAESFYSLQLLRVRGEGQDSGRRYLAGRGFGSAVCKRWGLGYAPGRGALVRHLRSKGFSNQEILGADLALSGNNGLRDRFYERVMFPIHDEQGRTIGFGGRVLGDAKPKYLNTKETAVFHKSKHLFAFDRAKDQMVVTGTAIVCEGYTDVISMHEAGITNAVAALGTALTLDHVRMIERFAKDRIICMFDGDAAGQRAAERAIQYIDKTKTDLLCVVLPDNQDPMEFLASHSADELRAALDNAEPLMEFVFNKRLEGYDLSVPGRRVAALNDMAKLLAPLKQSILLDGYATQLADRLGTSVGDIKRIVRETPVPRDDAGEKNTWGRFEKSRPPRSSATMPAPSAPSPAPDWDGPDYSAMAASLPDEYEDPYSSYDYDVPAGGQGYSAPAPSQGYGAGQGTSFSPSGSSSMASLSGDERMQVSAERELLALMAANIGVVRPYGDRIASILWTDSRHEAMAWAMLATPEGAEPAEVVAAAESVVADAPRILASGRLGSFSNLSDSERAAFLVDLVELWSNKREVRQIRGKLRSVSGQAIDQEAQSLFMRATELQRHINELSRKISTVS